MSILAVVCAIAVLPTFAPVIAERPGDEPAQENAGGKAAIAETIAEVKTVYTWNGYKCVTYPTPCGSGAARDPATPGDYKGCTSTGPGACTSSCTWCGGATTGTSSACIPGQNVDSCMLDAISNGMFKCGPSISTGCYPSGTLPPGEPYKTPSGCYCNPPTATPTGTICAMIHCV